MDLIYACQEGQLQIVKTLVQNKGNVNAKDPYGQTSLLAAAYFGHVDICTFLLDNNADLSARKSKGADALMGAA